MAARREWQVSLAELEHRLVGEEEVAHPPHAFEALGERGGVAGAVH